MSDDDRVVSNIDSAVAIDGLLPGGFFLPGSGVLLGSNHILTAGHVGYNDGLSATITGARVTDAASVSGLPSRANPVSAIPAASLNVTTAPLFPAGYNTSPTRENDIALLHTNTAVAGTPLGMAVFLDPGDLVGRAITTAGYPNANDGGTASSPDITGRTQYSASGTVHSTEGGGVFGTDMRITYSESVDTQGGQSGSGVWLTGDLFGETAPLVIAAHTHGLNDVTQIDDGTQSGRLITKDVYDSITAQMLADGSPADAATLPENVIVGTNPGFFSAITGSGEDFIVGSYRRERIIGQDGDDTLVGAGGDDRLEGGGGVDQALFSDLFANYDFTITDPSDPAFEFVHARGTQADGRDSTKGVEFGVYEFVDADGDGVDDDGDLFFVPLQADPDDPTKLKDGPDVAYSAKVLNTDGTQLGTISAEVPAFMFDGDVEYTINLGAENNILYNFCYIVDSSGSMSGTNMTETKAAYQTLTQSLIDQGIAARSQFAVVDFDSFATLYSGLDAQGAISVVNGLVASGGTEFSGALTEAESWYEGLANVSTATNIAFFLSDGFGSGASDSLQQVNEGQANAATVEVRAFGIGFGADLSSLNIIDSDNAVLLTDPSALVDAFAVSGLDRDTIDRIEVRLGGAVVDTIAPADLTDDTLGLRYEGTISGLEVTRTAENEVEFVVVFNDGTPDATLAAKITTGQTEVRQQTADGTRVVVNFAVNQADYTGTTQSELITANDLDNTITLGSGTNSVSGQGGDDTFIINGGTNVIDGGEGTDRAVFNLTRSAAGAISRSGDVVTVGADHTMINVEFLEFTDVVLRTADLAELAVVSLDQAGITASEGAGTADFVVRLANAVATDTVVSFSTRDGSAVAGSDYTAASGTVTIAAGQTTGTVSIDLLQDSSVEQDEQFFVDFSVSGDVEFAGGGTTATGAVRIAEDDSAIQLLVADPDRLIGEGDPGSPTSKVFTLVRSGSLAGTDTIAFAAVLAAGSTAEASDFAGGVLPGGSVTFAAGESTKTFTITLAPNSAVDGDRTFQLQLSSTAGSATFTAVDLTLTILDDDTGVPGEFNGTDSGDTLTGTDGHDSLFGKGGNDRLVGLAGNDLLDGGTGRDSMDGGAGDDTYVVDSGLDRIIERANGGTDVVRASLSYTLGANLERLILLGSGNLKGTGNGLGNVITGNSGANELRGGDGGDRMYGGLGNDDLFGEDGNDVLFGGAGRDALFGGAGSDTLNGGLGNDTLDGSQGADRMNGGDGNDIYFVNSTLDRVVEEVNGGIDLVRSGLSHTLSANVERLLLLGSGNFKGTGNDLANTITGNDGRNHIWGRAGDDRILGGGGDDTLYGGLDKDAVFGGAGHDALYGGLGDDTLTGGTGNDSLDGNAGADEMVGGFGSDTYVVDSRFDRVVEQADSGNDLVRSSVSHVLSANVERLILTGARDTGGTGNALGNSLTGSTGHNLLRGGDGSDILIGLSGNDTLYGGTGNDRMIGGLGADVLGGGSGNDAFVYQDRRESSVSLSGRDTIVGFGSGDRIDLRQIDADLTTAGDQAFHFIGKAGFGGHAGELRFSNRGSETLVAGDVNGDGRADFIIQLDDALVMGRSDFLL